MPFSNNIYTQRYREQRGTNESKTTKKKENKTEYSYRETANKHTNNISAITRNYDDYVHT